MYLSREEEGIYQGERGETLHRMMEILVALGDIYGAEQLIPVKSVQIAGVSYKNIGEAGLEWISDLKGRVVVPSILNPAGMDLCRWKEMGIAEEFALKQQETIEAYRRLGVTIDCTCTPYQIYDHLASRGDHLAWSESSAVSYANSVIGARTNREGGPSALAAALIGKTALYGYHLDENRRPTHLVEVDADLRGSDFGALGFLVGRIVKDGVPLFRLSWCALRRRAQGPGCGNGRQRLRRPLLRGECNARAACPIRAGGEDHSLQRRDRRGLSEISGKRRGCGGSRLPPLLS